MTGSSDSLWLLTGPLVLPVAIVPVVYWAIKSRVLLRWFAAGAAVWTVGVALKFVCAAVTYYPLEGIWASPPRSLACLLLGTLYSGALTGVFEAGTALAAGYMWRSWVREPKRAAAIGLGAGSCEAFLAGAPMTLATLAAILSPSDLPDIVSDLSLSRAANFIPWLIVPVERVVASIGHIAMRMLPLYAVASGRLRYFGFAFLISIAYDGFAHWFITASRGEVSDWWAVLGYTLAAIASIPFIIWCYRHWPPLDEESPSALAPTIPDMSVAYTTTAVPSGYEEDRVDASGGESSVSEEPPSYSRAQQTWHLFVLSLMTAGLYHLYWFYRNWRHLRDESGLHIRPGWRAVGMLVPVLDFFLARRQFREIKQLAYARGVTATVSPVSLALGYAVLSWAGLGLNIPSAKADSAMTLLAYICASYAIIVLSSLVLLSVQGVLNGYWAQIQRDLPVRTRLSDGEILVLLVGGAVTALAWAAPFLM